MAVCWSPSPRSWLSLGIIRKDEIWADITSPTEGVAVINLLSRRQRSKAGQKSRSRLRGDGSGRDKCRTTRVVDGKALKRLRKRWENAAGGGSWCDSTTPLSSRQRCGSVWLGTLGFPHETHPGCQHSTPKLGNHGLTRIAPSSPSQQGKYSSACLRECATDYHQRLPFSCSPTRRSVTSP